MELLILIKWFKKIKINLFCIYIWVVKNKILFVETVALIYEGGHSFGKTHWAYQTGFEEHCLKQNQFLLLQLVEPPQPVQVGSCQNQPYCRGWFVILAWQCASTFFWKYALNQNQFYLMRHLVQFEKDKLLFIYTKLCLFAQLTLGFLNI